MNPIVQGHDVTMTQRSGLSEIPTTAAGHAQHNRLLIK